MTSHALRRAASDDARREPPVSTLIDKVARRAHQITEEDIAAVKRSGLSEDQIVELAVCAAIGEATRQYQKARAVLIEAMTDKESIHD
jgi:alkylhydroperoxidase family enzyme